QVWKLSELNKPPILRPGVKIFELGPEDDARFFIAMGNVGPGTLDAIEQYDFRKINRAKVANQFKSIAAKARKGDEKTEDDEQQLRSADETAE
ncbi:MAG: hypothetical protein Q9224_007473, partial [Gallowayella concinna]